VECPGAVLARAPPQPDVAHVPTLPRPDRMLPGAGGVLPGRASSPRRQQQHQNRQENVAGRGHILGQLPGPGFRSR
jgi:hypothetical protein